MNFIDNIKERAKSDVKTIVLPESMDKRIIEAAVRANSEGLARIIVIGKVEEIRKFDIEGIEQLNVVDPESYHDIEKMTNELYLLRKDKGLSYDDAYNLLHSNYMYFACMLVKLGMADGIVSGACHSSADTLRPALQIIKAIPDVDIVSAFFLMCVQNCDYGLNGTFIFADSGLVQNPTDVQLACIAKESADSFKLLTQEEPIVAFISHSTKGSATHEDVDKVISAVNIAKNKYPDYSMDGELQVDAAIVPDVAAKKAPNSLVAGKANVLIFPDLDAGNSGYKLVERLAKAQAYGPICQGIASPVNDLSRGCSVEDILGVIAITAVQAQNKKAVY